jgi:hypothetical protein
LLGRGRGRGLLLHRVRKRLPPGSQPGAQPREEVLLEGRGLSRFRGGGPHQQGKANVLQEGKQVCNLRRLIGKLTDRRKSTSSSALACASNQERDRGPDVRAARIPDVTVCAH